MKKNILGKSFSVILDGKGGLVRKTGGKKNMVWHNMDYTDNETMKALVEDYKLDENVIEVLTEIQTRPRYFVYGDALVVIFRGFDGLESSKRGEMVSLRIFVDQEKIITLSHRKVRGIDTVLSLLEKGKGPKEPVECFTNIIENISEEIEKTVEEINYKVDVLESEIIKVENNKNAGLRNLISNMRRNIVSVRRYLIPNRDIFANIRGEKIDMLTKIHRHDCREIYNSLTKSIEDLEYSKDHLAVSFEELQARLNTKISQIMYKISIVTMIFMPMSVLTSLLGVNVNGIPFADRPYAFGMLSVLLVIICLTLAFLFRKLKWI